VQATVEFAIRREIPNSKIQILKNLQATKTTFAGWNVDAFQIGLFLMIGLFRDVYRRGWLNILEMRSVEHCEHT